MQLIIDPSEVTEICAALAQVGVSPTLATRLDQMQASLDQLLQKETATMAAMDDLTSAVSQETSVAQSAVTLIQGIAAQLNTLATQKSDAAIEALATQLTSSANALSAAVTANTPTAPTPAPAPAPAPTPVDSTSGAASVAGSTGNDSVLPTS